jgi:hypothetical protein
MKHPLYSFDPPSRREFIERCAATAFGLSVLPTASLLAADGPKPIARGAGFGKAKRIIVLQLDGGLSHIDTFDPKSGKSKGPGKTIKTSADFQVTQYLPKTAAIANKICVLRSMTAKVGVHKPAQYIIRTGFSARGTIRHPAMGAWATHYLGRSHPTMPSSVCINRRSDQGNGFFPSSYAPLAIGEPSNGVSNVDPLHGDKTLQRRLALSNDLDVAFRNKYKDKKIQAYNGYYDDALKLMRSTELKAFDLSEESEKTREAYGKSRLGQGCLLARRLVASGVRYIEIAHDGWDFHKALQDGITDLAPIFDQAYSALLTDLDQRGMLDSTLVVVATEFGRKPSFDGDGRGHHPSCFSTVLAGGGVKKGYVYGQSDELGNKVKTNPIKVGEFHATIGWAAGLPLEKEVTTPSGRPFTIGKGEKPLMDVFA